MYGELKIGNWVFRRGNLESWQRRCLLTCWGRGRTESRQGLTRVWLNENENL